MHTLHMVLHGRRRLSGQRETTSTTSPKTSSRLCIPYNVVPCAVRLLHTTHNPTHTHTQTLGPASSSDHQRQHKQRQRQHKQRQRHQQQHQQYHIVSPSGFCTAQHTHTLLTYASPPLTHPLLLHSFIHLPPATRRRPPPRAQLSLPSWCWR